MCCIFNVNNCHVHGLVWGERKFTGLVHFNFMFVNQFYRRALLDFASLAAQSVYRTNAPAHTEAESAILLAKQFNALCFRSSHRPPLTLVINFWI